MIIQRGLPLNPRDVPAGVPCKPHPSGTGVLVEPSALDAVIQPASTVTLLPETETLAQAYLDLRCASGGNGFGPTPISFAEMQAYAGITGIEIDRFTLMLLQIADSIYLTKAMEELELKRKQQEAKAKRR